MAALREEDKLSKIKTLLSQLEKEKIATYEATPVERQASVVRVIGNARQFLQKVFKATTVASQRSFEGFVEHAAMTFLKIGACQELTHRFCLEYFLATKRQDIAIVILLSPNGLNDNHAMILVGNLKVKKQLRPAIVLASDGSRKASIPAENAQDLKEFFSEQNDDVILVDPLFNIAAPITSQDFYSFYAEKYSSPRVIAVVDYNVRDDFVSRAAQILTDAKALAVATHRQLIKEVLHAMLVFTPVMNTPAGQWTYLEARDCFFLKAAKEDLESLLERFKETYKLSAGAADSRVQLVRGVNTGCWMLVFKDTKTFPMLAVGQLLVIIEQVKNNAHAQLMAALSDEGRFSLRSLGR